jgi:uncharacterized peroxidase-related enzyme
MLNECRYCVEHHFGGLCRLIDDDARATAMRGSMEQGNLEQAFEGQDLAGLQYAQKLTTNPANVAREDIENMRNAGFDDGQILEINQVTAYFAYANRMVLGLGINTDNDIIGLSPGDNADPDNWSHT